MSPAARAAAAVLGATALYATGIAIGVAGNVWLGTGVAAALAAALVAWAAPAGFWRLLVPAWSPLAIGVVLGLVMIAATHAGYRLVLEVAPGLDAGVAALYQQLDDWPGRPAAAAILAVVVVVEELVWRGLAIEALRRHLPPLMLVIAAAALYAVPQLATGSLLVVALGFACGLLWTGERLVTGSLAAPLATHLIWDIGVFIVWPVT